jgi:hypothetical protein
MRDDEDAERSGWCHAISIDVYSMRALLDIAVRNTQAKWRGGEMS